MVEGREVKRKFLLQEHGKSHTTEQFYRLYDDVESLIKDVIQRGVQITQGYIPDMERALAVARGLKMNVGFAPVEARFRDKNGIYTFCLKGEGDIEKDQLEKTVPNAFYRRNCVLGMNNRLRKTRLTTSCKDYRVDFDVYEGTDLIIAKVGFDSQEEAENFAPLGKDVSMDPKYEGRTLAGIV